MVARSSKITRFVSNNLERSPTTNETLKVAKTSSIVETIGILPHRVANIDGVRRVFLHLVHAHNQTKFSRSRTRIELPENIAYMLSYSSDR